MQYKKIYLALIFLSISFIPAFAQEAEEECNVVDELICVDVAEEFYEDGDIVVISGKVKAVILNTPVSIQVFYGDSFLEPRQVEVAQDGTFTTTIIATGPQWAREGTYLVRAAYSNNIAETNFEFKPAETVVTTTDFFEVDAGSFGTFDVQYTINGGTIKNIQVEPKILGLIVTIAAERDGTMTLELPRSFIDAKNMAGADERYLIFIDGSEITFEETAATRDYRTLKFAFEKGDTQIDIIGTFVIPEFGSYIILTLVLSLLALIVIQQKSKLQIRI
ncbi:MAG: PEFG-CTERM sorting domain-containing protein [Nitrosopumilales archaeon]|nr:PEFG-CTERM sorting domain-containing protein [Nitrosopumilales archaeon]